MFIKQNTALEIIPARQANTLTKFSNLQINGNWQARNLQNASLPGDQQLT